MANPRPLHNRYTAVELLFHDRYLSGTWRLLERCMHASGPLQARTSPSCHRFSLSAHYRRCAPTGMLDCAVRERCATHPLLGPTWARSDLMGYFQSYTIRHYTPAEPTWQPESCDHCDEAEEPEGAGKSWCRCGPIPSGDCGELYAVVQRTLQLTANVKKSTTVQALQVP